MHKKFHEKIKDYFINMGKNHRILLPLAVVGLFLTMFVTRICMYCKKASKRFACAAFILCCFFMGSSFAFPSFFATDSGFVSVEGENETIAAVNSNLDFANVAENATPVPEYSDADMVIRDESGVLLDTDIVYLDDMLDKFGDVTYESEDPASDEIVFEADDWRLVLINKQHPIPDDYEFVLGTLSGNMKCDERIMNDLFSMVKAAKEDEIKLVICSPYRDLDRQQMLFDRKINAYMKKGYSYMDAYKLSSQAVTIPGASEHQVGLAIDIVTDNYTYLDEGFADTDAGKWLKEHCAEYGFILRYPQDKENITSIEFEPWHFRYVGRTAATVIMNENLCLEEFWEKYL